MDKVTALDKSKPKKTIIRRKRKKSMADRVSDVIDDRGSDLSCGDETPIAKKIHEPHQGSFLINDLKSSVVEFKNIAPPEFLD